MYSLAAHGGEVVGLRELAPTGCAGARCTAGAATLVRSRSRVAQQAPARARVRLGHGRVGVDDQVEPAREVVDDRELLALHEQDVGHADRVGPRSRRGRRGEPRLDVAHRVVAEVAGEAAAEARQAGPERDLEAGLPGGDEVERVAVVGLDDPAVGDDLGAKAGGPQHVRAGRPMKE